MPFSNVDLRFVALVVLLSPPVALLIGPSAVMALGGAFLAMMVLVLVYERLGRVDAPGTEAGLATLFLWGISVILGLIGTAMVALAWRMPA